MLEILNAVDKLTALQSTAPEIKMLERFAGLPAEDLAFAQKVLGKVGESLQSNVETNKMLADLKKSGDFEKFTNLAIPLIEPTVKNTAEAINGYRKTAGLNTAVGNCSACRGFLQNAFRFVAAAVGRLAGEFLTVAQKKIEDWKAKLDEFSQKQTELISTRAVSKKGKKGANKSPEDLLNGTEPESTEAETAEPESTETLVLGKHPFTEEELKEINAYKAGYETAKTWIDLATTDKGVKASLGRSTGGRIEILNTYQETAEKLAAIGAKLA